MRKLYKNWAFQFLQLYYLWKSAPQDRNCISDALNSRSSYCRVDTFKRLTWCWLDNFLKRIFSSPHHYHGGEIVWKCTSSQKAFLQVWETQGVLGYCTSLCIIFHHGTHSRNKMEIIMTGSSRGKNIISSHVSFPNKYTASSFDFL